MELVCKRNDSRSAERTERSAPRPQLSGDPPAFFGSTEEAVLRLEKGLRARRNNYWESNPHERASANADVGKSVGKLQAIRNN
jgi:hypothetical protein